MTKKVSMTCKICKIEQPRDEFPFRGILWGICKNEDCIKQRKDDYKKLRAENKIVKPVKKIVERTCIVCNEIKNYSEFPHKGANQNVCHLCFVDCRGRPKTNMDKVLKILKLQYPELNITKNETS